MKKIILLFCIWLFTANAHGQVSLGIGGGQIYGLIDSVCIDDVDSYLVWVKNTGNQFFNDYVFGNVSVDTGNGLQTYLTDSALLSLNPGDSLPIPLTNVYDTSATPFRIGGNIVVIWPSALSATTSDSAAQTVTIKNCVNSLPEYEELKDIKIFPNPGTDIITISCKTQKIYKAEIFDMLGKRCYTDIINAPESVINISAYNKGVYTLKIMRADGTTASYKLVKK
jgi:hypothetical protein